MFDPVAELGVLTKEIAAEHRDGWPAQARSERVLELMEGSERLAVQVVRAVAEWDAVAAWSEDGALTAVTWICQRFPMTTAEAQQVVKVARLYTRYPQVAAALDSGEIALAHARILAKAERGRTDAFATCADGLLDVARQVQTLKDFAQVIGEWIQLVDDQEPADDSKRAWRSVDSLGGWSFSELAGPTEDHAVVRAAIDALDTPDPADCPEGPRTMSQRHYDIVMDIFRRVLADTLGDDPDAAGGADIIVDPTTLAELQAHPDDDQLNLDHDTGPDPIDELLAPYRNTPSDRREAHDHHGCGNHGNGQERRCELTTGERATRAFAAALVCSGWIRRVLRDPDTGTILDMGRRQRLFTRTQRRALVYRDGGCVFPGCDRPAKFCDAHHLKPWEHDGLTDLVNGVLLCRRHHKLVHQGWDLARTATTGAITVTSPDGRTFTRQPKTTRFSAPCDFDRSPTRC